MLNVIEMIESIARPSNYDLQLAITFLEMSKPHDLLKSKAFYFSAVRAIIVFQGRNEDVSQAVKDAVKFILDNKLDNKESMAALTGSNGYAIYRAIMERNK